MKKTLNGEQIDLPFRIFSFDLGYSFKLVDFKTNSALEYRYETSKTSLILREAYLVLFPSWGEVKLGKQIHAWGSADAINPTDNINPYDYYYMFLAGTGKKIGTFSFSSKLYRENFQFEFIVVPNFIPNRLPYGERDFPVAPLREPEVRYSVQNEVELGFRLQATMALGDLGLSYFNGNDRIPSIRTAYWPKDSNEKTVVNLGYRKTETWGGDLVTFLGDFTVRGEGAVFKTKSAPYKDNFIGKNFYEIDQEIFYSQYVIQLEYSTASDLIVSTHLIGSKIIDEQSKQISDVPLSLSNSKPHFNPGMGTPLAMLANKAIMISSNGVLMRDQVELAGSLMMNLEESGIMLSATIGYSPFLNWKFEFGATQFKGNDNQLNSFTSLESFNHARLGLLYNF